MLYGSRDYNEDGYTIYTTLDLDYQAVADARMKRGIQSANEEFRRDSATRLREADNTYIPIVNGLTLLFDLESLRSSEARVRAKMDSTFQSRVNPVLDASALLFGLPSSSPSPTGATKRRGRPPRRPRSRAPSSPLTTTPGTSCPGGRLGLHNGEPDHTRRPVQAHARLLLQALYYSAAIDSRKFSEATLIYDEPMVFHDAGGKEYIPSTTRASGSAPSSYGRPLPSP
jgi:penicillin-binding protein 1A